MPSTVDLHVKIAHIDGNRTLSGATLVSSEVTVAAPREVEEWTPDDVTTFAQGLATRMKEFDDAGPFILTLTPFDARRALWTIEVRSDRAHAAPVFRLQPEQLPDVASGPRRVL